MLLREILRIVWATADAGGRFRIAGRRGHFRVYSFCEANGKLYRGKPKEGLYIEAAKKDLEIVIADAKPPMP